MNAVAKIVAKPRRKAVLAYHPKAQNPYHRLPFMGKHSWWSVPATGGYDGGCEAGRWAAVAYLKAMRADKDMHGCGTLQMIVLSMVENASSAEAFKGQVVGFFSELDHHLHVAAAAARELDDYTEHDLCAAMNRAINFDHAAWSKACATLEDLSPDGYLPVGVLAALTFHAYRKSEPPKPKGADAA